MANFNISFCTHQRNWLVCCQPSKKIPHTVKGDKSAIEPNVDVQPHRPRRLRACPVHEKCGQWPLHLRRPELLYSNVTRRRHPLRRFHYRFRQKRTWLPFSTTSSQLRTLIPSVSCSVSKTNNNKPALAPLDNAPPLPPLIKNMAAAAIFGHLLPHHTITRFRHSLKNRSPTNRK